MWWKRNASANSALDVWAGLMEAAQREPDALADARARVHFSGADPALPSRYMLGTASAAALAALGTAVSDLWELRGGAPIDIAVDLSQAAAALRANTYLRIDGEPPPSPWDPLAGFYATGDGRYLQLHTNFPHHRDAVCRVLAVAAERDAVTAAVASRAAFDLEDAIVAAGGCATATRSKAEWDAHPQGRAVATLPLLTVERIGDADPEPLPRRPTRPLAGVRVLDLTRVLAGPTAGRCLAEHGADVLAVCSPQLPNLPTLMLDTNHGKRSAHLHLEDAADLARLHELVAECDVFLQAYRPGALERFDLRPESLARRRPGIVCVELSAYGETGPWRDRRGYDTLVQSACGIALEQRRALATGPARDAGPPRHLPCSALDYITGFLAAYGACVALARRALQGGSWRVSVSLAQTARWLDGLGRCPAKATLQGREPQVDALMIDGVSPAGQLRSLGPVLRFNQAAPGWRFFAVPAGTHPARWAD